MTGLQYLQCFCVLKKCISKEWQRAIGEEWICKMKFPLALRGEGREVGSEGFCIKVTNY